MKKMAATYNPEEIRVGSVVRRMLAGTIPVDLIVQKIENGVIDCGWTFDLATGAEIDKDLGWGPKYGVTGSYLIGLTPESEKQDATSRN